MASFEYLSPSNIEDLAVTGSDESSSSTLATPLLTPSSPGKESLSATLDVSNPLPAPQLRPSSYSSLSSLTGSDNDSIHPPPLKADPDIRLAPNQKKRKAKDSIAAQSRKRTRDGKRLMELRVRWPKKHKKNEISRRVSPIFIVQEAVVDIFLFDEFIQCDR